jgi:hypothetical protein
MRLRSNGRKGRCDAPQLDMTARQRSHLVKRLAAQARLFIFIIACCPVIRHIALAREAQKLERCIVRARIITAGISLLPSWHVCLWPKADVLSGGCDFQTGMRSNADAPRDDVRPARNIRDKHPSRLADQQRDPRRFGLPTWLPRVRITQGTSFRWMVGLGRTTCRIDALHRCLRGKQ